MSDFINTDNTDHRELMSHSDKRKKLAKQLHRSWIITLNINF